jgi:thymidylate kinase
VRPQIICLVGSDGSGKSTLAAFAVEQLRLRGRKPVLVWSRYNHFLSKPLLAFARLAGYTRVERHENTTFGYHDFHRSALLRWPFVLLQALDVNLAIRWQLRRAARQGDVLVFERSPWDTLADVMLDTRCEGLESSRLGRGIVASMSGRSSVLLVARTQDNIARSRPAMRFDRDLSRKLEIYERLCKAFGWHRIENNGALEAAQQAVLDWLDASVAQP